jgi:hypothetical protein
LHEKTGCDEQSDFQGEIEWTTSLRAKQAAEKGLVFIRTPEKHPSGSKDPVVFAALMARLKSCPFKASTGAEIS